MNTQRSAVALRLIIVAAVTGVEGDSLDQLNTNELPDGMLVSVLSNEGLYRFVRTSTDIAAGAGVVVPAAGPGRFLLLELGIGASPFTVQVSGTTNLTGTTAETDDTWIGTPVGTNFYTAAPLGDAWSVGLSSGIATYEGPAGKTFRVSVDATLASAVAAQSVELAIDRNTQLTGTTSFVKYAGVANVSPTTVNLGSHLHSEAIFTLNPGDVIAAIMRDTTASNNITVSHLNMVITPV